MATMWARFLSIPILTFIIGLLFLTVGVQRVDAAPLGIINGEDVAEDEQPWMVGLLLAAVDDVYTAQFCGGTLIHAEWVMTAAHCTFDLDLTPFGAQDIEIVADSHYLGAGVGVRVAVDRIVRHREFDFGTYHNDIALLHLAERLDSAPIVTINDGLVIDETATMAAVIGWGITESGIGADTLKQAELPVVSHKTCADFYRPQGYIVAQTMLCAGYLAGGIDACAGDSGGPLMVWHGGLQTWVQTGIISAGAGCAEPGYYGLYTQISDYATWLDDVINHTTLTEYIHTIYP